MHVAPSRDCDNKHGHLTIIDRVDHATVTNAILIRAGETAFQCFDVIPGAEVFLKRFKASCQLLGDGFVAPLVESLRLPR